MPARGSGDRRSRGPLPQRRHRRPPGRTAVFTSAADSLVPDGTGKVVDVFLRRLD
ncbi:hypothetical protein V7793_21410 [Streptomyces sp. KLMMK]|uniref:hypothetical protein n=1 Tax=Streptomyces sp. KLMMK TaxID=3109353 RepID=UPI003008F6C9